MHAEKPMLQRRPRKRSTYRAIAVGVYGDQADSLVRTAAALEQIGLKANRSFVIQALIRKLQADTEGLAPEQIVSLFMEQYLRKPPRLASSRTSEALPGTGATSADSRRPSRVRSSRAR